MRATNSGRIAPVGKTHRREPEERWPMPKKRRVDLMTLTAVAGSLAWLSFVAWMFWGR